MLPVFIQLDLFGQIVDAAVDAHAHIAAAAGVVEHLGVLAFFSAHHRRKELKARGVTRLKVVYSEEQPQTPKTQYMLQKTSDPPQEPPQNGAHVKSTPSSISYVPPVAGMILAGEVIKGIIGN